MGLNYRTHPLLGAYASGGSRGFLLVLKNYPFSELKKKNLCSWKQDQIVSELLSKFHMYISRTL